MNLLGFPNAPGLSEQNVGLLDQRAAYVASVLSYLEHKIDPKILALSGCQKTLLHSEAIRPE